MSKKKMEITFISLWKEQLKNTGINYVETLAYMNRNAKYGCNPKFSQNKQVISSEN
jgi:hypothetical protein